MHENSSAPGPRVAIVGGGIGGLAAAVLLDRAGFSVVVAERDAAPSTRDQGGSIAIDAALGRPVLERMGLGTRFAEIAHPEATAFRMRDRDGNVLFERPLTRARAMQRWSARICTGCCAERCPTR